MRPGALIAGFILLTTAAWAHRLDEYLQATRVSLASNRVEIAIALTPGVAVANKVLAAIDQNRDGQISESERAKYAQRVLRDLRVHLDRRALDLRLVDQSCPLVSEMKEGVGVIKIRAAADNIALAPGGHQLRLRNAHLPAVSVYLANAVLPADPSIRVLKQARDRKQRDYRLSFELRAEPRDQPHR